MARRIANAGHSPVGNKQRQTLAIYDPRRKQTTNINDGKTVGCRHARIKRVPNPGCWGGGNAGEAYGIPSSLGCRTMFAGCRVHGSRSCHTPLLGQVAVLA